MPRIQLYSPDDFLHPSNHGGFPPVGNFKYQFLAQGDSWFSIGALPPWATSNLLNELTLGASACAPNCGSPGKLLRRMVDSVRDPKFTALLVGNQAWAWRGILLSGGGNDLIDAIGVLPR